MSEPKCDLCDQSGPLHLGANCHKFAPLKATLERGEIVLTCYLPSCGREVARYKLDQGVDQADEIARLQAEVAHWKANHDAQVARNVVLRDRTDLTPEQWAERQGFIDDAKRYRWLRDGKHCSAVLDILWLNMVRCEEIPGCDKELDAAIDAARRE